MGPEPKVLIHSTSASTQGPCDSARPSGISQKQCEETSGHRSDSIHGRLTRCRVEISYLSSGRGGLEMLQYIHKEYYTGTKNHVLDLCYGRERTAVILYMMTKKNVG